MMCILDILLLHAVMARGQIDVCAYCDATLYLRICVSALSSTKVLLLLTEVAMYMAIKKMAAHASITEFEGGDDDWVSCSPAAILCCK